MIKADSLTKRYGERVVVDDVSFTAKAGKITAMLGPAGAGKSTTLRLLLSLARADSGHATICGRQYHELRRPTQVVGALMETPTWHARRTVRDHLLWLSRAQGLPARRISAVTDLMGLTDLADKPAGTLSRRMRQRMGVAAALLGDPAALVLDEPVRGLDPPEEQWMRDLMRRLAAEGRAVLVSGHRVRDLAAAADDLIVIDRGRLLAHLPAAEFAVRDADATAVVRTVAPRPLAELIRDEGGRIRNLPDGALFVAGLGARRIAELAAEAGLLVYELTPRVPSLEEVFADLIGQDPEQAESPPQGTPGPPWS